jgi:putative nucleotidyltransferase with HDIG domain
VLLISALTSLVILYLARFQRKHYQSNKTMALLSLISILTVFGLKVGDAFLGVRLSPVQFGFINLACICACAMLISSLISPRVALLIGALLSVIAELILGNGVGFAALALVSSMVATLAVSDIRSRHDLLRAGLAVCASNAFLCIVVRRLEPDLWSSITMVQTLTWAAASGLLSIVVYYLAAALFERIFGIVTHLGLLELSDPNRPLLQKFCQIAPGTYTHSMMVGSLASTAADAVGADALLCRVGAYYHDLGKMKRPEFFIENQLGGENAHDKLTPSLSALVVTAHVKDGLEIAEAERLPPVIKAFIREHHGTCLIQYFYHRQLNGETPDPDSGLEQQFRYAGPKPQSRETAILMLADSVEAASRNLSKPTHARIEDLVDKIFAVHLRDGQLDESDLTLKDLRAIRDALVNLLVGMLHVRVDYPDLIKSTSGRTQNNGVIDQFGRFAERAPGPAKNIDPPSASSSAP